MTTLRLLCGCLLASMLAGPAAAEPVDVRQGPEIGSGFSFGRGETCTVLTAGHVVRDAGDEITVTDRTGGRAVGERIYYNEAYDLALVELPRGATVACNARWPDARWMASWQPDTRSSFDVIRHYPGGRELLVALRYAGGSSDSLTLAFVDRLRIVASDSGSLARLDGKPVGIVRRVLPESDRVDILRFDLIDRLVGERFRGSAQGIPVALTGVMQRGRANPNWSTYVRAWLSEQAGRVVVEPGDPSASCRIGVDVIEWRRTRVENPAWASENARLANCRNPLMSVLGRNAQQACERPIRENLRSIARQLPAHQLVFNVSMTPRARGPQTKLATVEVVDEDGAGARAEDDLKALQAAVGPTIREMFAAGACD